MSVYQRYLASGLRFTLNLAADIVDMGVIVKCLSAAVVRTLVWAATSSSLCQQNDQNSQRAIRLSNLQRQQPQQQQQPRDEKKDAAGNGRIKGMFGGNH